MKHRRLITQMRASADEADALLRAYDRVLDDLPNNGIRHDGITCSVLRERRQQLDSDMRRLRGELALLESREPIR